MQCRVWSFNLKYKKVKKVSLYGFNMLFQTIEQQIYDNLDYFVRVDAQNCTQCVVNKQN